MPGVQAMSCRVKDAFPSRRVALAAVAHQLAHADRVGRRRPVLNVFRCECCGLIHVGSADTDRPRHTRRGDY